MSDTQYQNDLTALRANIEQLSHQLISARSPLSLSQGTSALSLPDYPGVYAFWYFNSSPRAKDLNRAYRIQGKQVGKGYDTHQPEWNWNLEQNYISLYVGKSLCIAKRIKQHLYHKIDENIYTCYAHKIPPGREQFLYKPPTACQFRSGFDWLFKESRRKRRAHALQHSIFLSTLEVPEMITRFYLEDYLIGTLLPWFNLDSER